MILVVTFTQVLLLVQVLGRMVMVFPVVLGSGKRLFRDGSEKKVLKLVETRTFSSGVVVLTYQPAS